MLSVLAKVSPLHLATGQRLDVRVASAQDRRITGLGGKVWEPAMVTPPSIGIALWNGDFTDAISAAAATLPVNVGILKETYAQADDTMWIGAPVEIYAEPAGTVWPWRTLFRGKVTGFTRKSNNLSLTCEVDSEPFKANVLVKTYAGTTGAEGPVSIKDKVKPLVLGWAMNVEPQLIDSDDSVYQFSGYGPIEGVTTLYERGSDFGASVGDYATYAALVAATIPRGRWATCLAAGMVRLGAPAYGVITGDVRGHVVGGSTPRLTGKVIQALAQIAGIDPDMLQTSTLDTLDAEVPFPINLVLTDQTKFIDIAQQLARCCNAQAGVSLTGEFFATRVAFDRDQEITFDAQGRAYPQVTASEESYVSVPYWRTTIGANRSWRVHSADEIAFEAPIIERGLYSPTETYREGNWVSLADGSEWLYIALAPTSGNAPPAWPTTANAYWQNKRPPTKAQDITFNTGQTIEALKPAEANATNGAPAGTPVGDKTATDVSSTVKAGGGVATDQVATAAIQNVAVSKTNYTTLSNPIPLPDAVDVDIFSLTVTKDEASSLMRIEASVIIESDDDIRGDFTFYNSAGSASQVYSIFMNGALSTFRTVISITALFSGLGAGTTTHKLKFRRNGGATVVTANANSLFSVREEKK
ncbi:MULTISPECIES: hypothetical protein [unclassified Novosphingobium]|uniref:hypothetical protein n=1 Tax=unclassified Novosphingobium TaxID=2644732 RepID=UPI000D31EBDE|nr:MULTISPECIES: hypothetical protein [unclassified Novosphingobium]PTR08673.1 hypothetical protein C8K11_111119 [Novosphingobium sp. GV055]PUB01396.1 hypothetical protein C8K12_111119 [Novosphingobium sp. GV061]PUB16970.1 hypothetical protein C8K14_111119 [Novosphingobium sp. GV079]PUB39993.1 hypothetical protein C8K10_111119 [Novosphingobium sp. GV027]